MLFNFYFLKCDENGLYFVGLYKYLESERRAGGLNRKKYFELSLSFDGECKL
jgi:hypothetical protein